MAAVRQWLMSLSARACEFVPTLRSLAMTDIAATALPTTRARPTHAGAVHGAPGLILRLEAAAVFAGAVLAYDARGGSWVTFAILFLAPDLSMLGYLAGRRIGAAAYNLGHSYLGSMALGAAGLALHRVGFEWTALIWVAHVGFDRMLGFGLKYPEAFGATHLGFGGKARVSV
jgi:uncharacterized protein DUF4260